MDLIDDFDIYKLEGFDWDEANIAHIAKHKVVPEEAEQVFYNRPLIIFKDIEHSVFEPVYGALGRTNEGRLLSVAFVIRDNLLRVATTRDQSRLEREIFALE